MVKREEVEALREHLEKYVGCEMAPINPRHLSALLDIAEAVMGAPVWWVDYKSASTCTLSSEYSGGQQVRLVRVGGGREGT